MGSTLILVSVLSRRPLGVSRLHHDILFQMAFWFLLYNRLSILLRVPCSAGSDCVWPQNLLFLIPQTWICLTSGQAHGLKGDQSKRGFALISILDDYRGFFGRLGWTASHFDDYTFMSL